MVDCCVFSTAGVMDDNSWTSFDFDLLDFLMKVSLFWFAGLLSAVSGWTVLLLAARPDAYGSGG